MASRKKHESPLPPVEIVYDGKDLSRLEQANIGDEEKLVTQAMAGSIAAALEPLKSEIEKEGGAVTVDIKGPAMFEVSTEHLSEKLGEKVRKVLTPR